MVTLRYHGHSCWQIDEGDYHVLIDPFLTGNDLATVSPDSFDKLDAIIITHGHGDHIGDTEVIARKTGATCISVFEVANYLTARNCTSHAMHVGGSKDFDFGRVKLTIAHHGSSGPNGEYLGSPVGVVLTMGGKKIYHAGDTGLFMDMKLIGEINAPLDVALLPIGDNFTMGIDDAVKAAELLEAWNNIPMHYDTFPQIQADPNEFVVKASAKGIKAEVISPGQLLKIC